MCVRARVWWGARILPFCSSSQSPSVNSSVCVCVCVLYYTTFLRLLSRELPTSFVAHDINAVSKWYHWLDSVGCTLLSEVDCKDRFNNVHPTDIHDHFSEASEWLSKRKR